MFQIKNYPFIIFSCALPDPFIGNSKPKLKLLTSLLQTQNRSKTDNPRGRHLNFQQK